MSDAAIIMMGVNSGVGSMNPIPPVDPLAYFCILVVIGLMYALFMKILNHRL